MILDNDLRPIIWDDENNQLILIDQRKLPNSLEYFICKNYSDVVYAIKDMVVRGAPAIGVSAAYGMALAELNNEDIACSSKRATKTEGFRLNSTLENASEYYI